MDRCSVQGCCSPVKVHKWGYCNAHYLKFLRYGDPEGSTQKGTHGLSYTAENKAWRNMKSRCYNPKTPGWKDYGGRGISVCAEWRNSFEAFYRDMGPRPSPQHSVDRWPNVNGNYEPSNCRWATQQEQRRNIRTNHLVQVDGEQITLAEAVEKAPVPYNTVLYRLKRGWSVKDAVSHPAKKGYRPNV